MTTTQSSRSSEGASQRSLAPGQEAMWILNQLEPSASGYNVSVSIRFPSGARQGGVRRTMELVARRHPILRTVYVLDSDGAPVQRELSSTAAALWTEQSRHEAQTKELIVEFADRPFDLAAAPPFRALLIEQGDGSAVICLVLHHIATDGRSQQVLVRDFTEILLALTEGRAPELPAPPPPYFEFLTTANAEPATDGLEYWTRQLHGGRPTALPEDAPQPGSEGVGRVTTVLDAVRTTALRNMALRSRASFFALLTGAFSVSLARAAGTQDVVFGSVFDGRTDPQFAETVGYFVNTVAIRSQVSPDMTRRELLRMMQRTTTEAASHQNVPFSRVVTALRPTRSARNNPLFDVLFVHGGESDDADGQQLPHGPTVFETDRVTCSFQVEFLTQVVDGRLEITVTYEAARFRRETIAGFTDSFLEALDEFLTLPDVAFYDAQPTETIAIR